MIKSKLLPLVLVAFALCCSSLAYADSVTLVNPGFEDGNFTGYTQGGNTGGTNVYFGSQNGIAPQQGSYQAVLGPSVFPGTLSQSFHDNLGEMYTLSYYLANEGRTPSFFSTAVDNTTLFSLTNPNAFNYTLESQNFVGTGSDSFTFTFQQNPTFFHLDDISITGDTTVTPEPSSLVLLGSGMLGLAGAFRRRFKR